MPLFDIDLETLRLSLQQASLAGIGLSFLAGLYLLRDYLLNHH